jgi:hypothetical protein
MLGLQRILIPNAISKWSYFRSSAGAALTSGNPVICKPRRSRTIMNHNAPFTSVGVFIKVTYRE